MVGTLILIGQFHYLQAKFCETGKEVKNMMGHKVCLIIIVSNSGADNSASRHDSLNLKGSAESGEEND